MNKDFRNLGIITAGVWTLEFLFYTPRGERILLKIDRVIFPKWLTK